MTYQSYINLTDVFVEGIGEYLRRKGIPLEEVVEVFAGNGKLGLELGLKENCNISDSLLFAVDGYEDFVNMRWDKKPKGVVAETAYETAIRFHAEDRNICLMIIGAPLPANSYYCPSYEVTWALHHLFDAQILYIGEMSSLAFGSPKFFAHMEEVEDDLEQSFTNLVVNNYDSKNGFFTSKLFEKPIVLRPYLLRFKECEDEKCDCHHDSKIKQDVQAYFRSQLTK